MSRVRFPVGVTGIFHWLNPSGLTWVLVSTQSLTKMSTGGFPRRIKTAGKQGWEPYHFQVLIVVKFWEIQPAGALRACTRIAFSFYAEHNVAIWTTIMPFAYLIFERLFFAGPKNRISYMEMTREFLLQIESLGVVPWLDLCSCGFQECHVPRQVIGHVLHNLAVPIHWQTESWFVTKELMP
jgi:hypothetical protein